MPDVYQRRRPSMDHGEARYARAVHHQHERHLDRRQATSSPHTTRRAASTPTASVVTLSISGKVTTVTLDPGDSPPRASSRAKGTTATSASAAKSRSSIVATSSTPVVPASNVNAEASATPTDANYNPNGGPPRLTTGQTYGLIAGGIGIGLIILGMLVFFCYRKRKEKADEKGWWKLQDGQHEDIKEDKDSRDGRMMGQRGGGNTGRVSPYRERDSPNDRERLDVDISAPVLQRAPSSNARLGPWSAENGARDLGPSSGRDTPSRPLRPSQLIARERQQREELLAMPARPSPSASKITQWSNTTLVENSSTRTGLGIDNPSSPYLIKSSNQSTPRIEFAPQEKSLASLGSLTEGTEYPPTRARQPPARMESREDIANGLNAKTDTIWGLADSYTDRGEVDGLPKHAPRGDSRRPQYDERDTRSSFDSTPRGSGSAKGTSETSNTSYADPPSTKPPTVAIIPPRLPRSDSIRRPGAQAQAQQPAPPLHAAAPPPMPPLSSSPPSAINQVRAALQQSHLTSPTASSIMSAPSPNDTLRSPALHVDLRNGDFRLPSDLQELARFASEPSPDLGRARSPLPFLSDVTLERKASNATLRAADAFTPTSRAYEPQVRNGTSPLAVVTHGLPYSAQPASASASVENAPARSPIAAVQAGPRRPDLSIQGQGQQNGVQLVRKVSISRDPLGPVRLSREDSLKMRMARNSPSPLDSNQTGHTRSPSTELEEIDSFSGHRQSDAPNGTEGDRTGDRDTLGRYDDLFELEAAARSSTSSVPRHESLFTPLTFDVPQTKPLSFSANTSTAGSGPPTPTTPAFQVNVNGANQPTVVVAEASPRTDSTITLHAPPPQQQQTQALRTKASQPPLSASPSADGFIPLGQMSLAVQQPNYRSATESIYGLYD